MEPDHWLLVRLRRANEAVASATVELSNCADSGELPADGLRALGRELVSVAEACFRRADDIDRADPAVVDDQAEQAL